jgi:hypothetical protein
MRDASALAVAVVFVFAVVVVVVVVVVFAFGSPLIAPCRQGPERIRCGDCLSEA